MKKLILTTLLVIGSLSAQAQASGSAYYYPYRSCSSSSFSVSLGTSFGGYPEWYAPAYYAPTPYTYPYYASYASYPGSGYDSNYSRPNYAVGGTLLGAGIGAIIGNNVNHQTWQGAAIGAGAGLLLGGLAEHGARKRERAASAPPTASYVQPNYIADAPSVNNAPTAPAAPPVQNNPTTSRPASAMSGANSLFGR